MKLLNLGCGATRPKDLSWINIDNLHAIFPDTSRPERMNMDAEPNYLNHDLNDPLPFESDSVDGILASHVIEHFTCCDALRVMRDWHKVLKSGGVLRVSVPDPKKMHQLTLDGADKDPMRMWGDPNPFAPMGFMEAALFFNEHMQLVTEDALKALFLTSGFRNYYVCDYMKSKLSAMGAMDNRQQISLFMEAVK